MQLPRCPFSFWITITFTSHNSLGMHLRTWVRTKVHIPAKLVSILDRVHFPSNSRKMRVSKIRYLRNEKQMGKGL